MTTTTQKIEELEKQLAELKLQVAEEVKAAVGSGRAYTVDECNFHVIGNSQIFRVSPVDLKYIKSGRAFKTREAAEKLIRYEELEHELRVAQKADFEVNGEVDWSDGDSIYVIRYVRRSVEANWIVNVFNKIHFKTDAARDKFFNAHTEADLKLLIMGVGV